MTLQSSEAPKEMQRSDEKQAQKAGNLGDKTPTMRPQSAEKMDRDTAGDILIEKEPVILEISRITGSCVITPSGFEPEHHGPRNRCLTVWPWGNESEQEIVYPEIMNNATLFLKDAKINEF